MSISDLEQTTALRILVYLLKRGAASRTDLRRDIDASVAAIYNALPKLRKLGLIKEEGKESFPFTIHVSLTEKGKKVAEHLEEIERILTER
jgi:DNA-binding MarR family transcriptional regulator